jgi:hypothetical protein
LLSAPAATAEIAAVQARRAALFAMPVDVWLVEGRDAARVAPAPPVGVGAPLPVELLEYHDRILIAGAVPAYEHGVLTGEVSGLEVCRVVPGETGWQLEVGVGKYDREVHQALLAGDEANLDDALRRVIADVREHRQPEAGAHPANTLATERWLRDIVIAYPDLIGASFLTGIETTEPRTDLRQPAPAAARGFDEAGDPVVVVCTAGHVDIEAVPIAADTRLAVGQEQPLVLVVDPPAVARVTRDLAAALQQPATVAVVPADWRGLPG